MSLLEDWLAELCPGSSWGANPDSTGGVTEISTSLRSPQGTNMRPQDCGKKERDATRPQVSVAANYFLLWSLSYLRASDSTETSLKTSHSSQSGEGGRLRAAGTGETVLSSARARIQVISAGPCCNSNLGR